MFRRIYVVLSMAILVLTIVAINTNAQEMQWEERFPATSPSPRAWHNMAYDSVRNVVVLFGGFDYTIWECLNETWEWDGINWTIKHDGTGTAPDPRARHAMVFDRIRGITVLFGGACSGTFFGDTWTWDGETWTQTAIGGTPGIDKPVPRICRAAAFDTKRGVMVVFGGYNGSSLLCDLWEWDGTSWSDETPENVDSLITDGLWPDRRFESSMAFDPVNEKCLLYGGEIAYSPWRLDDTWLWDGTNWKFIYNSGIPRHNHGMVTDNSRGRVILFGGNALGTEFLNNTFEWDGAVWDEIIVDNPPAGRQCPPLAFDSTRRKMVLFGGYVAHHTGSDDTWEYGPVCVENEIIATDPDGAETYCATIQEAVDISGEGWKITVGSGAYDEYVIISGKTDLTIKTACGAQVQGFKLLQCDGVTIEGFTINPEGTGKHGVAMPGGISHSSNVTISGCDIFGADNSYSGIKAYRGNANIYIENNHIHNNGRNGVAFADAAGGPHFLTGNLIEENGWNGVRVPYGHVTTLTGNTIKNNGTKTGITGGRYGVLRVRVSGGGRPEEITLINNIVINNNGKIIAGQSSPDLGNYDQMLDETDSGNTTTSGDEGPGVS